MAFLVDLNPERKKMKFTSSIKSWAKTHAIIPLVIGVGSAAFLASCKRNFVTITWKNEDGTVLEVDENVKKGTTPTYDGETPKKDDTPKDHFTFDKWSPEVVVATEDATYTAVFTSEVRKYTIVWKNADGTVLETDENVPYGTTAEYNGATPTKASSNTKVFTFNGWDKTPGAVEGDTEYVAKYSETDRLYNVQFLDYNGDELYNENHLYHDVIDDSSFIPSRDSTSDTAYDFTGWDNELVPVCADNTVYHATYQSSHLTFALVSDTYYRVTGLIDPNYEGEIHIPATWGGKPVKVIAENAFMNNTKITAITFDEHSNITEIGSNAFSGSALQSADIIGDGMVIDGYAFSNCRKLTSLTLNGIKQINGRAFERVSIQELTLPASLDANNSTAVKEYAFSQCWNLYLVTLNCSLAKVTGYAFYGCGSVTEVVSTVGDPSDSGGKLADYCYIWLYTEDDLQNKRGTFTKDEPNTENSYLGRVYYTPYDSVARKYLVSAFGPGNILHTGTATDIKESAFAGNFTVEEIIIGADCTRINKFAFDGCSDCLSLSFELGGENPLTSIGQSAFRDVNHSGTLTIPARAVGSTCYHDQYAFHDLRNVSAFAIENDVNTGKYKVIDGVLYQGNMLYVYPQAKTATSFTAPSNVTSLNQYVGIRNNNLEELHFASTTTLQLSCGVISGSNLTSITFESSVALSLYWYPFSGLPSLRTIELPANTTCSSMVFCSIGTKSDKPCDVFFRGTALTGWKTDNSSDGPWWRDKASYCGVYVYSESDPGETAALDHTDGYWHYVADVPTKW